MDDNHKLALKRELMAMAEEMIDETLAWDTEHPAPTFDDIEGFGLQMRRQIGQRLAQALCEQQAAARPVPGPRCPVCGREMHYKDEAKLTIGSLLSEVTVERSYYYCDHCQSGGIFPPG